MNEGIVLIYHRIVDLEQDPHRLSVNPVNFQKQIRYLNDHFSIISLKELVKRISIGKSIKNCVVITFDDGYYDNLYFAKPILEKFNVPATIFVTVGMVGSSREFWWDELERIFLIDEKSHKTLRIEIEQQEYLWDINNREDALKAYQQIHPCLKYVSYEKREKILDDLFAWVNLDRNKGRKTHSVLNQEELLNLACSDVIEIGSHTLTHSALSAEPQDRLYLEIKESKTILEEIIQKKVHSFSFPFGQKCDFDDKSIKLVKDSGYECGILNIQKNFSNNTDLYQIPRRIVRNWRLPEFQNKMEEFLPRQPEIYRKELKHQINRYLQNLKSVQIYHSQEDKKRKISSVLSVNHLDQKGGAAKVCSQIFKHLQQKKFDSYLLVRKKLSSNKNVRLINQVNFKDQQFLDAFQNQHGLLDVFHYSSFNLKNLSEFQAVDIVHLHNIHKNYFSLLALPELTCLKPVVWTLHDMFSITGHCINPYDCLQWENGCGNCQNLDAEVKVNKDNTKLLWKLKEIVYQYANFSIVCPSKWLKSKLEHTTLNNKKITLIYNGVDEKTFKNIDKRKARKLLNLPQDKTILLFVAFGGLKLKTKGGNLVEKVLEQLKRENIFVLSIGAEDRDRTNIRSLPYVEDEKKLALYYSAADLFLYPTMADNCPLVVLESLSCGTPVVAFNTGGIPELITHQKNGYIAEYNNLNDLKNGVEFFLGNPGLLKKASKHARKTVLKKFTLKHMLKNYINLYEHQYREFFANSCKVDIDYSRKITKLLDDYLSSKQYNLLRR